MKRLFPIAAAFYIVAAILTFGHAAANWKCDATNFKDILCGNDNQIVESIPAAIFWPFYWSWELQE